MEIEGLKQNVQEKFAEIRAAVQMREKLLLRQIDVIAQLDHNNTINGSIAHEDEQQQNVSFVAHEEAELLAAIRSFGRFQLGKNLALQDGFYLKHEDYIAPSKDHETLYKFLKNNDSSIISDTDEDIEQAESIVVDFSRNKSLMEHNAKHINKSIINITLQEAKELIKRAKQKRESHIVPLNLEELNDEQESSIAEVVSSLGRESSIKDKTTATTTNSQLGSLKAKSNRFKPNITINNCNGTINLRNISNVTINCASENDIHTDSMDNKKSDSIKIETCENSITNKSTKSNLDGNSNIDETISSAATTSNSSSNASSRSQSRKQKFSRKLSKNKNPNNNDIDVNDTITTNTTTSQLNNPAPATQTYDNDDYIEDEEHNDVTCDFYNRLLNEIKNSLIEKPKRKYSMSNIKSTYMSNGNNTTTADTISEEKHRNSHYNHSEASTSDPAATTTATGQDNNNKRLILKNFENLKIILDANSDEETYHPVQIEQWLAEIISETDLEPIQNNEILEHSQIYNETD